MQFDFESVRQRIINNLRAKNEWAQILDSSTIDDLVSPFAEELSRLDLKTDYLVRETRWNLAQNISSLASQSTINGYTPRRKVGARGLLKISASPTFDAPPPKNVVIPLNTIFPGEEFSYASLDSYVLTTSDDFINIEIIQGVPSSLTFTAGGINFEEFIIDNDAVENDFFSVTVNGITWNNINDIREAATGETVYQILNEFDYSGIRLRFGNNVNGKRLELGDQIVFSFYETEGANGNIESSNVITSVESTLFHDDDTRAGDLTITNENPIEGGANEEGIADIRRKAPKINQSVNSATTNDSYEVLVEDIPSIYKAVVMGAIEYNEDLGLPYSTFIPSEENLVRISAFTDSGNQLSNAQKDLIVETLRNKKAPTDIITFEDVEFIKLRFNVTAFAASRQVPLSTVRFEVENFLETEYSLFTQDFKKALYESTYKAAIDKIPFATESGLLLNHHNTTLELLKEEVFNAPYTADLNLFLPPIQAGTIKIFIRDNSAGTPVWEQIGADNGTGGFTAEAGYSLAGSSINYATGTGALIVASGLTEDFTDYDIRIFYSLTVLDVIPVKRNQILSYDSSVITPLYPVFT